MKKITKKAKVSFILKNTLKKDFTNKVILENKYKGVSEALNHLLIDFLEERKNEERNIINIDKTTNGFYINEELKKDIEKFINETQEFTNTTDLIYKIIYKYLNTPTI
jgi:metal-responsive CopG/Arc/MetJ family transcriptional regulator